MKHVLSKVFLGLGCVGIFGAIALLIIHIYWGDKFFPVTRYFSSPQSHFFCRDCTDFSVALAGDSGAENYVLERVIDDVRASDKKYAFMLYLGDFITKKTNTGLSWMLYEIKPRLGNLPFYSTPGNHDVERRGILDKSHYRSTLGSPYYWFGYGDVLFIALDSSSGEIEDMQFEWLENTMTYIRPLFKHCVIYTHKPPKDVRPDLVTDHRMNDTSVDKLAKFVRKHKTQINVMMFGHVHYYSHGDFAGVPIYTIPSSGQPDRSGVGKPGYVEMTFSKNGIKSIEPHYIEFHGPTREFNEYALARRVFDHVLRETVSHFLLGALVCFIIAGALVYDRKKK